MEQLDIKSPLDLFPGLAQGINCKDYLLFHNNDPREEYKDNINDIVDYYKIYEKKEKINKELTKDKEEKEKIRQMYELLPKNQQREINNQIMNKKLGSDYSIFYEKTIFFHYFNIFKMNYEKNPIDKNIIFNNPNSDNLKKLLKKYGIIDDIFFKYYNNRYYTLRGTILSFIDEIDYEKRSNSKDEIIESLSIMEKTILLNISYSKKYDILSKTLKILKVINKTILFENKDSYYSVKNSYFLEIIKKIFNINNNFLRSILENDGQLYQKAMNLGYIKDPKVWENMNKELSSINELEKLLTVFQNELVIFHKKIKKKSDNRF